MNRCQKRTLLQLLSSWRIHLELEPPEILRIQLTFIAASKKEFIKLCQAIGMGFIVMGAIGYFIRIIHIPVNQILVS